MQQSNPGFGQIVPKQASAVARCYNENMTTASADTWAALFLVKPKSAGLGYQSDLDQITNLGFTIVSKDHTSGETKVLGYGPESAVFTILGDYNNALVIRPHFFKLVEGMEITEALLKQWTIREDVATL